MSVFKNSILFLLSYLRKTIIFYSQPPLDISFFQASICHTLPGRTTSKTPQPQWVSFPQFCENVGKLKKFNNQGMKVQAKKQAGSIWNFPQPPIQVYRGVSIPYFKINAAFFSCPYFFERISQLPGKDQQNGKQTFVLITNHHHVSLRFRINLKNTSTHISIDSFGLYRSMKYLLNFLSNLYIPPWSGKTFKFMM